MRPKSINLFEMLGWAATALGATGVLIAIIQLTGTRLVGASAYLLQFFLLLLFVGLGVATGLASRKRHDVARAAFFVFAAVIALALLLRVDEINAWRGTLGVLFDVIDLLTLGTLMAAAIALLQTDAAAWMVPGGIQNPPIPLGWTPPPGQQGGPFPPPGPFPPAPAGGFDPSQGTAAPVWHDAPTQGVGYPAPAGAAGAAEETRTCPYCHETIRAEASKCRYCGSEVEPLAR